MDDAQLHDLQERTPELAALFAEAAAAAAAAADAEALEQVRVHMLGRKSRLTEILRSISSLPPEQRPVVGKLGNIVRVELETADRGARGGPLERLAAAGRWRPSASTSRCPACPCRSATST